MIRGVDIAAQGMIAESWRVAIYTNNLANISTGGFKRDELAIGSSFSVELKRVDDKNTPYRPAIGNFNDSNFDYKFVTDNQRGSIVETGNPLDLAITGSGFFTIQGQNTLLYTRNGNFTTNTKGELITGEGFNVLGEKGNIVIPGNKKVYIDEDGRVVSDGKIIDRILIKDFTNPEKLSKLGSGYLVPGQGMTPEASSAVIKQGHIEGSNVNTIREMVNIMESQKNYQANERAIKAQMETLTQAVTSVGRVG